MARRVLLALLGVGIGVGTGPVAASSLAVTIGAGSGGAAVGTATFTRTPAPGGSRLDVDVDVPPGLTETSLCVDDSPFTTRVPPGSCPWKRAYSPAVSHHRFEVVLATAAEVWAQVHVVTADGETAFAGHRPGKPFYGNVRLAAVSTVDGEVSGGGGSGAGDPATGDPAAGTSGDAAPGSGAGPGSMPGPAAAGPGVADPGVADPGVADSEAAGTGGGVRVLGESLRGTGGAEALAQTGSWAGGGLAASAIVMALGLALVSGATLRSRSARGRDTRRRRPPTRSGRRRR